MRATDRASDKHSKLSSKQILGKPFAPSISIVTSKTHKKRKLLKNNRLYNLLAKYQGT